MACQGIIVSLQTRCDERFRAVTRLDFHDRMAADCLVVALRPVAMLAATTESVREAMNGTRGLAVRGP
ncbi:MAG: hypothetical protein U0746_11890 [Gemmataceae bacterium]